MRRAMHFAYYTARFFSRFLLSARIPREFFLGEMSPPVSPFPHSSCVLFSLSATILRVRELDYLRAYLLTLLAALIQRNTQN